MPEPGDRRKINRIVILSLDSLCTAIAVPILVRHFQGRIAGICLSRRHGGKYGSAGHQIRKTYLRSGIQLIVYGALQLILFYPACYVANALNWLARRPKRIFPIRQLARRNGIPIFSTRDPNSLGAARRIRALDPDLIVSIYFDYVIRQPLIDVPRLGIINVHPGILPDIKGPTPNIWAMIEGRDHVGATVHYIDSENLDTGPILKAEQTECRPGESVLALDCRVAALGAELAIDAIADIENGSARAVAQNMDAGRYLSFPTREDLALLRRRGRRLYRMRDFIKPFFADEKIH